MFLETFLKCFTAYRSSHPAGNHHRVSRDHNVS